MNKSDRGLVDPSGQTRALLFGAVCERLYARVGGSEVLGPSMRPAREAYHKSLVADAQPGTWLEVPLLGEPGYDLNVFYRSDQLAEGNRFLCGDEYGYQTVIDWLASVPAGGFGVGIAHDLRGPQVGHGAYVNPNGAGNAYRDEFFCALGETKAGARSSVVVARQPKEWVVMEEGVFANRAGRPARIASGVGARLQQAYAADSTLLERHLRQVGFTAIDPSMIACLCEMAASPLDLWLEFDVLADGSVGDSLGADLLFGGSVLGERRTSFVAEDVGAAVMGALEARGLADDRWRRLAEGSMATIVPVGVEGDKRAFCLLTSAPTFVKAKWAPGEAPMAKIYQNCDAKLLA